MFELEPIIKGCKKQKADCQKILYQRYFSIMMGICYRYGSTKEDAEEMLNNGFLKIFTNINQFEGKGSFEGWMKRIMVNNCLDFLKSKQVKQTKILSSTDLKENSSFDNKLFEQGNYDEILVEKNYEFSEIKEFIDKLQEPSRTIFNLSVFEEYSHKEIGVMLNIAERTSQWHFSNAKKKLSELLILKKAVRS